MAQVLFLNYHSIDIGKKSEIYHVDNIYSVREDAFVRQMQVIKDLKIPVISLTQYLEQVQLKKPFRQNSLVITFDDGFLTDYEVAYPILKEQGFQATFFVCLRNIKSDARWQQMQEMIANGFTIGSHTVSHAYLCDIPESALIKELETSKRIIEEKTGQPVSYLAPPGGRFNQIVIDAAASLGYKALVTTQIGLNSHDSDPWRLKRWTVRYQTSLAEFTKMIHQDKAALQTKIFKSEVLNLGKKIIGNKTFDKIRGFLLPDQS